MSRGAHLVLLSFTLALVLVIAWFIRAELLLVYISAVFAVVISPAVDRIHALNLFGWRPGRGTAILLIVLAMAVLLAVLFFFGLPPVIADLRDLAGQLPGKLKSLQARLQTIPGLRRLDVGQLQSYAGSLAGRVTDLVTGIAGLLATLATAVILTAYLILDGAHLFDWSMSLFPAALRVRLRRTLLRAGERMRRWLVGQLMLMLILGSASAVAFGLIGIRYFYLLAVFAGVANIIPMLGPIATVIVASLVAAMDSWWKVLGVVIFYLVYQQVENAFLTPRIMKSQVDLSSAAVLIALLLGGALAGVAGALVAVPTAVLCSELVQEYLVKGSGDERGAG